MFSGYVDGLRKLLFNFPKEKREEIIKKYASRTPEPLNQQFSERLSKEEAIKAYKAKKALKKTTLFPPGQLIALSIYSFQLSKFNMK